MTIISFRTSKQRMNLANHDKSGFSVAIQCAVRSSDTMIRFPCLFSVQWHTNNQKVSIETAKYSPQGSKTDFNEDLVMRTQVAFDRAKRIFLKKETQVQLNLISKSRPDQSKLVGRVTIDLASILNDGLYSEPTIFPLQFCSVNGSLTMSFKVLQKTECDISLSELEISCGEGMSLSSVLKLANASSSIKEKQRESADVPSQVTPVSKNKIESQMLIKRQLASSPPPQVIEATNHQQVTIKKDSIPLVKEITQTQTEKVQQKPVTRSFKNITAIKESIMTKKSEVTQDISQQITDTKDQSKKSSFKKLGSISSEEGKINESARLSEDFSKQKLQNDRLRMETERYRQQTEMYRLQLEKAKQDYELVKMELKQKKSNAEQTASDTNHLKSETAKLREDLLKSRQESVQLTLKLAQLREAHNKSLVQLSINERELTKLQGVNERLQSLLHQNEQLQNHNNSLQTEVVDYQSRCQQLQLQKADLTSTLNNLDQMHQQALSKCTQHEQALSENKGSFETEMRVLKEHLKLETKEKMELQLQIQQLNQEIERLMSVASEFDEARHSWEITEGLNNDENQRKNARLKELEENLITLDDRVRWLQGENELLTQNCRKNREDYLKIKSEKEIHGQTSQEEIRRYEQTVQQLKDQNHTLQGQITHLQQLTTRLQQQCDQLKSANDFQTENILQLQTNLSEVALKNHQLQELVININQLRDKQREENTNKQRDYVIRIAELEGNNQQLQELVQANAERVSVVEDELKGRENLIMRLQEGLRTQVERSEQLNNRVMYFLQKEERMKETVILLELQSKKVTDLLVEQEAKEIENQESILKLQATNSELLMSLQESLQYGKGLQQLTKANESSSSAKITTLSKEIEKKQSQINQNKLTIQTKTARIKEIEEQFAQFKVQAKQVVTNSQQILQQLKKQKADFEAYIVELEGALAERSAKVQSLQSQLSSKQNEVAEYHTAIEKQTAQFQRMCEQLKEVELNHQKQHQDAQERYLDISNKYQELQVFSSNKEKQCNENISQYEQHIKELKDNLDAISKDNTTLAITTYKSEIKQKNEEIKKLQADLKSASIEAAKVPNLQRALKIRNIELNSLKFKGKNDGYEGNELLRLKDQEISALTVERQRFLASEAELQMLREKSQALATELELIQEQKFNIESLSNERALLLEQARDENKKLMDEITIIGERNGQLEKTLQQMLSQSSQGGPSKSDTAYKAEITLLKGQLKQYQQMKKKVYDLEQTKKKMQEEIELKEEEHMIALLDQQLKNTKNDSHNSNENLKKSLTLGNNNSKQIPNLATTYKSLKQIIDQRRKYQDSQKLIQLIQNVLSHDEQKGGIMLEKSRGLSKEFQRLKVQILKSEGKGGQQKVKLMNLFRGYESLLTEIVRLSEGVNY